MSQIQQSVFLDTSIQVERVIAGFDEFIKIEDQIGSSNIQAISSSYVWMEYQRSVVADYAHVHRVMSLYNDWGLAFKHILDGSRAFRPRSAVRCTQIIGTYYQRGSQNLEMARDMIEDEVTRGLRTRFWNHVTPISDTIVCDLVTKGIAKESDGSFKVSSSCRKEKAACHLPKFLADSQGKVQLILDYLKLHSKAIKDQTRVQNLLERVIENPNNALGQSSCWPLGDIIIALQVPDDAMLWTLDADFQTIAAALEISLYQPMSE